MKNKFLFTMTAYPGQARTTLGQLQMQLNLLASQHNINITLITVRRLLNKLEWTYENAL